MSYVDEHLLPGEELRYRAHLHKIIFLGPAAIGLVGVAVAVALVGFDLAILAIIALVLASLPLVVTYITYVSSEFAVTDKRVVIKTGWLQRTTLELMLAKVEGIGVDQSLLGRMLDAGTITVIGTGGTDEHFPNIAAPLEFRRQVQSQISTADHARATFSPPAAPAFVAAGGREERDCPHCAERILARARVCKHCGRDVVPVASA
jgi:uncharacterized membrane protein YdbT with pleckstrin-like domain